MRALYRTDNHPNRKVRQNDSGQREEEVISEVAESDGGSSDHWIGDVKASPPSEPLLREMSTPHLKKAIPSSNSPLPSKEKERERQEEDGAADSSPSTASSLTTSVSPELHAVTLLTGGIQKSEGKARMRMRILEAGSTHRGGMSSTERSGKRRSLPDSLSPLFDHSPREGRGEIGRRGRYGGKEDSFRTKEQEKAMGLVMREKRIKEGGITAPLVRKRETYNDSSHAMGERSHLMGMPCRKVESNLDVEYSVRLFATMPSITPEGNLSEMTHSSSLHSTEDLSTASSTSGSHSPSSFMCTPSHSYDGEDDSLARVYLNTLKFRRQPGAQSESGELSPMPATSTELESLEYGWRWYVNNGSIEEKERGKEKRRKGGKKTKKKTKLPGEGRDDARYSGKKRSGKGQTVEGESDRGSSGGGRDTSDDSEGKQSIPRKFGFLSPLSLESKLGWRERRRSCGESPSSSRQLFGQREVGEEGEGSSESRAGTGTESRIGKEKERESGGKGARNEDVGPDVTRSISSKFRSKKGKETIRESRPHFARQDSRLLKKEELDELNVFAKKVYQDQFDNKTFQLAVAHLTSQDELQSAISPRPRADEAEWSEKRKQVYKEIIATEKNYVSALEKILVVCEALQ